MAPSRFTPPHRVLPGAGVATLLSPGGLAYTALEGWPVWARGLAAVLAEQHDEWCFARPYSSAESLAKLLPERSPDLAEAAA